MQYTYHTTGPSSIHRKSHLNNGITTVKMGMPFKPNTMAQGSMFSNARAEFTENVSSVSETKNGMGRLVQEQPARIYRPSATGQSVNRPQCRV